MNPRTKFSKELDVDTVRQISISKTNFRCYFESYGLRETPGRLFHFFSAMIAVQFRETLGNYAPSALKKASFYY